MRDPGIPLTGGQMTAVERVGDTVRRHTGPWSPAVHCLLRHLESCGFTRSPRVLGVDASDREILTYIDGDAGFFSPERVVPSNLWSDRILIEAASLLRRFHDTTIGLDLPAGVEWQPAWPSPSPHEVICHNDFAPYNCVFRSGHLIAAIDFDGAAPGSRAWDLAYAAYTFIPLYTDDHCRAVGLREPPDRERRLRLLCDTYGLDDRAAIVDVLEERLCDLIAMINTMAAAGDVRFQRKIEEGHLDRYHLDVSYLRRSRSKLLTALEG